MSQTSTVFLFVKGTADYPIEQLVADAQIAASLDTLDKLCTIPEIDTIVVATRSETLADRAHALGAHVENDPIDEEFHWGKVLTDLVRKYRAAVPLYIGGGSGVLMTTKDWRDVIQRVLAEPNTVVANNYFSCDFCAWSPGSALDKIEPPEIDNDLAYRFGERLGLRVIPLAKNAATQLDIDTPTDLLTTSFSSAVGTHLREFLDRAALDTRPIARIRSVLANHDATVLISGRVSASLAMYLEQTTRCQWRIFSEERGMRASGRIARGQVRSFLGDYIEWVGAERLFETCSRLANAAIMDTRVLFAHRRLNPTASDRFNSDLLRVEEIADPFVHELTSAARHASIPLLLGGHSLVSGGMYALAGSDTAPAPLAPQYRP